MNPQHIEAEGFEQPVAIATVGLHRRACRVFAVDLLTVSARKMINA